MTVAFLGLGRMGSPMAANLARAGFPLVVYNRTTDRARQFAADNGVEFRDTPAAAAAEADVVVTMLADQHALKDVYEGEQGVLAALGPGKIAIDMGTVGPSAIRELVGRVAERGAALLDAPVSGSVPLAEKAELMIMVGGDEEVLEGARSVLEAMGSPVLHVGPSGAGAAIKLAVNAVVFGLNQALSEGLVLAERGGVDRRTAYGVFAQSAVAAPVVHYRRPVFEDPDEAAVTFTVDLAAKDLRLILDAASDVGAPMPQAEANLETMEAAGRGGYSDGDMGIVAKFLRERASDPVGGRGT